MSNATNNTMCVGFFRNRYSILQSFHFCFVDMDFLIRHWRRGQSGTSHTLLWAEIDDFTALHWKPHSINCKHSHAVRYKMNQSVDGGDYPNEVPYQALRLCNSCLIMIDSFSRIEIDISKPISNQNLQKAESIFKKYTRSCNFCRNHYAQCVLVYTRVNCKACHSCLYIASSIFLSSFFGK